MFSLKDRLKQFLRLTPHWVPDILIYFLNTGDGFSVKFSSQSWSQSVGGYWSWWSPGWTTELVSHNGNERKECRDIPGGILHITLSWFSLFTTNNSHFSLPRTEESRNRNLPLLVNDCVGFCEIASLASAWFLLTLHAYDFLQPRLVVGPKASSSRHSRPPGVLDPAWLSPPRLGYEVLMLKQDEEKFL